MRFTHAALSAVALASVAIPAAASAATAATPAAPATVPLVRACDLPGPWVIGTNAVKIRKSPSISSTAVGVLYKGHRFTVHSSRSGWHYVTDLTTGVKGWVSGTYVYREVRMCLD
ncbi:SH3 domain-containing protein [Streptomyces sp. NPDC008122]|uniref:SH3 domain-containing protein n=1 Tax=Streptomyces sp. NPDC008122 TaxID=3364810 RepID=UPI0036E138C7